MAYKTVQVDTHTKGKNSQPFSYTAIGTIEVQESKNRDTGEITKTPVLVSDGFVTDFSEATNAFLELVTINEGETPEAFQTRQNQALCDALVRERNREARRQASPTTEYEKTDELTPIVDALVAGKFLAEDKVGPWRRLVTQMSSSMEESKLVSAARTKEYRAGKASGLFQ